MGQTTTNTNTTMMMMIWTPRANIISLHVGILSVAIKE
jgi:hypothetical protein